MDYHKKIMNRGSTPSAFCGWGKFFYMENFIEFVGHYNIPINICVVGSGGTGGAFIPLLSRFINTEPTLARLCNILIIDGDTIEEKNLSRQPFFSDELMQNKAVVLAQAIKENFENVNIKAFPHYLNEREDLSEAMLTFNIDISYI